MNSIIFDVDGTLWDSTDTVAKAWSKAVSIEITSAQLKSLFGQTMEAIAAQLFPDETAERQLELMQQCCDMEEAMLRTHPGALYPQLEETLKLLSSKLPLYIVSNCQAGYIEVFLESTGLGPYFRGHLCPGDTGNGKADNIRQIIREHNLTDAVYVGDTAGDCRAAKEAGIPFIFASYGFGAAASPDYTINQFSDLLKLL